LAPFLLIWGANGLLEVARWTNRNIAVIFERTKVSSVPGGLAAALIVMVMLGYAAKDTRNLFVFREGSSESQGAKDAGLRWVSDHSPGIRRVRAGKGFKYVDPRGKTIKDDEELHRIVVERLWIVAIATGEPTEGDFFDNARCLGFAGWLILERRLLQLFYFQVKSVDGAIPAFHLRLQFLNMAFLAAKVSFDQVLFLTFLCKGGAPNHGDEEK